MSDVEKAYELLLKEILLMTQKELTHIDEIYNLTKELADAFSRNDKMSAGIILKMRGKEVLEVDKIRRKIASMLFSYNSEKERIENLLQGIDVSQQTDIEKRLCTICKNMKESVKKTTQIDKHISSKVMQKK